MIKRAKLWSGLYLLPSERIAVKLERKAVISFLDGGHEIPSQGNEEGEKGEIKCLQVQSNLEPSGKQRECLNIV